MENILIIGGGRIGSNLSKLIALNGQKQAVIWDIDPEKSSSPLPLEQEVDGKEIIIYCAPAEFIIETCEKIQGVIGGDCLVVSLSKGLQNDSGLTTDQVWSKHLPTNQPLAILAGPMMAEELESKYGRAVIATKEFADFQKIEQLFQGTNIALEYSDDQRGTALCGVLKNVYAIVLGICDALELGGNAKGFLGAQSLMEMVRVAQLLGGSKESILGTAGLGDFLATGFSPFSSNYRAGLELGAQSEEIRQSEGIRSLQSLIELLKNQNLAKFPLLYSLDLIYLQKQNPQEILQKILFNEDLG